MRTTTKNGILVGVAVACGLGLSARPWMLARSERASAAKQILQAERDEAQMVRDRTQQSELATELGKEELLRQQGYRKTGEIPFGQ